METKKKTTTQPPMDINREVQLMMVELFREQNRLLLQEVAKKVGKLEKEILARYWTPAYFLPLFESSSAEEDRTS